jgi:8-oxo-dGTP diphosphatase
MSSEDVFHLGIKALIRNQRGQVLLMQVNPAKLHGERKDYWDLPGGRVQKDDSIEDTLRREVLEETGIAEIANIQPVSMVLSNIRIPVGNHESVGLILSVYTCTIPDDTPVMLSDEHVAYEWFAPKKAAELLRVKYPESFCKAIAQLEA